MDKVTMRIIFPVSVVGFTLGILGLIGGIVYLASIRVNIPDVMQIVLVSLIGAVVSTVALLIPSPLQGVRRAGDYSAETTYEADKIQTDEITVGG